VARTPPPPTAESAESALPAYLRVLRDARVLLCTLCASCYTRQNVERYIRDVHGLTGHAKKQILTFLATQDIAQHEEARSPPPGRPPITGLSQMVEPVCVDMIRINELQ
jgi:hypothetical protein